MIHSHIQIYHNTLHELNQKDIANECIGDSEHRFILFCKITLLKVDLLFHQLKQYHILLYY